MTQTAILHYTAPPIVGGVEAVILAHAQTFTQAGYPVTVIAGQGEKEALPAEVDLINVPDMHTQHQPIVQLSQALNQGQLPPGFEPMVERLATKLKPILTQFDNVIVHNVFTKHFNLPLTACLDRLLDQGAIQNGIAWCHDFTWTSPRSRSKVHPGYPWDLLRTQRPDLSYVVVSQQRQATLAQLFDCPLEEIQVVYNGVDPQTLLGLSPEGQGLIARLGLLDSDLILLMPVRVTQAKNVEYGLRVLAALKQSGLRAKLILTGPPDPHSTRSMAYFQSLQALRRQLGVEAEMRFVFESGPDPDNAYTIDEKMVGDLFRVSDLVFMPSHREGFGMPVLEAGLVGAPMVCTDVPAAKEIGRQDVIRFDAGQEPAQTARQILDWTKESSVHRLRRRVRQNYTWRAIFERDIRPLLDAKGDT